MIMQSVYDFLESPLVVWAKSVLQLNSNQLDYEKFPNGEYFYLLLKQTDPRLQNSNLPNEGEPYDTTRSRLLNLDFILRNTRSFYQDILNHILLIKLPDIYQIAKYPESEETFKEMEKMLLLLLGVAINGEFKEQFIEQIQQSLDTQTQIALIPYIQLVTDDISFSISKSLLVQIDSLNKTSSNSKSSKSLLNNNAQMTSSASKSVTTTLTLEINNNLTESQSQLSPSNNNDTQTVANTNTNDNISITSVSATSSATSFTQSCQQLVNVLASSQTNNNNSHSNNSSVLNYTDLDQLNYFLNNKIIPNVQRIVDERDSYLESIIELQQDKDYLGYKLNNTTANLNLNCNCNTSINDKLMNINKNNSNSNNNKNSNTSISNGNNLASNSFQINQSQANSSFLADLVKSAASNFSSNEANANLNQSSSLINSALLELSDSQTLIMLIESIYKELASSPESASSNDLASKSNENNMEETINNITQKLNTKFFGMDSNNAMLLNDLKNKKLLTNNWNQKIAIELVECKIKLRQLINEIEEKCEQIEALQDEINEVKKQVNKLRNENVELQEKAALANVYADELESLREKSIKVDKYELEMAKLKERIEELQETNSRLEEYKEENVILLETRSFMEKQLNDYQVRLLGLQRLDVDLNKYKQEIDDLLTQRELDKKRLCELCEKNAKYELEMKNLLNQNVNLDEELNYYKQRFTFTSAELSKQQQQMSSEQKTAQSQATNLIEHNKLKLLEAEQIANELSSQLKHRDQELSKLKESYRIKEINLDECLAKLKVLNEELNIEQDNKTKYERTLEQHKMEIKELQLKLDDCVAETRKLDHSIRAAAQSNELKESENQENFKRLIESHEQLNNSYKKLLNDHEELQKIYLQLEADYDELFGELKKKQTSVNSLGQELDELKEKYSFSLIENQNLESRLNTINSKQFCDVNTITDDNFATRMDIEKFYEMKFRSLNDEISDLRTKRELVESKVVELSKHLEETEDENINLKNENQTVKIELAKTQDKLQAQMQQLSQLNEKIQSLENINEKLEDEKSQLFEQLHLLLQQNQEILTQTLNSKDMYHEETKAYMNQLNNLKRQKEMLEQKIMEQYKNSPSSQKQKNKKLLNGSGNNNAGLLKQFVQKVRNKSASYTVTSDTNSASSNTPNNNNQYHSDLTEDSDSNANNVNIHNSSFCHKYSADDVNYLTIQSKEKLEDQQLDKNKNNIPSCLSSSSTSSSSLSSSSKSSSSSSCAPSFEKGININTDSSLLSTSSPLKPIAKNSQPLITPQKQVAYIINNSTNGHMKLDPKSLKLGGRSSQSICSSASSSPIPQQQSYSNSPIEMLNKDQQTLQIPVHGSGDFKRALFTSSPKLNTNQSPSSTVSSSSTSSCSSASSSSSASLIAKVSSSSTPTVKTTLTASTNQNGYIVNTPQKVIKQNSIVTSPLSVIKSPIAILTQKNNSNSIQLITPTSNQGSVQHVNGKSQKIAAKLADTLNKLRLSNEYNEIENIHHDDHEDEDEDDEDDETFSFINQTTRTPINKTNGKNQNYQTSNLNGSSSKNANEIWLEYGCI